MYAYAAIMRSSARVVPPRPPRDPEAPLDAADLCRRLSAHITAQEKETRRRSRAQSFPQRLRPTSWLSSGPARDTSASSSSTSPSSSSTSDTDSPPRAPAADVGAPYNAIRVRERSATAWSGDWDRRDADEARRDLALDSPALKRRRSTREKLAGVLSIGLGRRRKSVATAMGGGRESGGGGGDGNEIGNGCPLARETAVGNYSWDDEVPDAVHVQDTELEKCASSSTMREAERRRSRRASLLARLRWHGNHGAQVNVGGA